MKITTLLATDLAAAYKDALDGGFIYVFSGPVPDSPEDALDMATLHTQLLRISLGGTGTGLTFDTPAGGVVTKPVGDDWKGTINFDGTDAAEAGTNPLTGTFARFCATADTGRGAGGATKRLQMSVSGPNGNGELILSQANASLFDNGTNEESANFGRIAPRLQS